EVVVVGPVDSLLLVVACRRQPQLDLAVLREALERQEEAPLELRAVRCERVDFAARVGTACETVCRPTTRVAADGDDVALPRRPFALHSKKPARDVEDQVIVLAV